MNTTTLAAPAAPQETYAKARVLHEAFWRSVRQAVRPPASAAGLRSVQSASRQSSFRKVTAAVAPC